MGLLASASFAAPPIARAQVPVVPHITVDTAQLRIDASVLAHDSMLGRATGSRGEAMAAAYIESRLRAMGLEPLGSAYRLTLPLLAFRADSSTSLRLQSEGGAIGFRHGEDFFMDRGGRDAFRAFEGNVVFAGLPEDARASVAGIDLRGRVIAIIGTMGADALELEPDWIERGVSGILEIVQDTNAFPSLRNNLGGERLAIDAPVEDPVWQSRIPRVVVGRNVTASLFENVTLPPAVLRGEGFPAVVLPSRVRFEPAFDTTRIPVANIAGVIPGSDPELSGSFVAFSAHYDHLGVGAVDERGDSIYNGFTDNAAGVAMLLGIADALRTNPPARSVLFLFFTAEERGLLGATWFVTEPPVELDRIAALVNLDGGAPPRPPVEWRVAGNPEAPFSELAGRIITDSGWKPNVTGTAPNSDHWPFLRRGVPSVFLIPGNTWEHTTDAERLALRERWDHYHQPADAWSVDYPFAGIARYAELAARIGLSVANRRP
jgi:hypothetical protein